MEKIFVSTFLIGVVILSGCVQQQIFPQTTTTTTTILTTTTTIQTVVLSITDAECASNGVTVWVRNDGTMSSGSIAVSIGTATCTISSLAVGAEDNCKIGTASPGAGYHTVRASTTGAIATGSVYCAA